MANKYKLAIVASHPIQYQSPLWRFLAERENLDVTVYYLWDFGKESAGLDKELGLNIKWDRPLLEGYKYVFLKNYSLKPGTSFWGQINFGIIKALREEKFDAVLVHGYTTVTSWLIFLTRFYTKAKIILRGEANLQGKKRYGIKSFLKKILLWNLFKTIPAFLYSYKLNKEFYSHYGVPDRKLFFFPCAADNDFFSRESKELSSKKAELRKKLGIKNIDAKTFIFVGKLMPRKRPKDILDAAIILSKENLEFNILFVGDGEQKKFLENFKEKANLENIYFFGFKNQTELPEYYASSDALLLSSEFDPSPKQINEAMNFGLPSIVSTGVGTAEDLIFESGAGIIYKTGDIKELAENMKKIIKEEELSSKMSLMAREALRKWNYENDAKGILDALNYLNG